MLVLFCYRDVRQSSFGRTISFPSSYAFYPNTRPLDGRCTVAVFGIPKMLIDARPRSIGKKTWSGDELTGDYVYRGHS